jgi:hypothetical protein
LQYANSLGALCIGVYGTTRLRLKLQTIYVIDHFSSHAQLMQLNWHQLHFSAHEAGRRTKSPSGRTKNKCCETLLECVTSSRKALNSASSLAPDGHLQHPNWSKIGSCHSRNLHKSCRSCKSYTEVTEVNSLKECPASSTLLTGKN